MSTTPEGLVTKILTGIEYPSAREDDLLAQAHTFHGLAADLRALHERQREQSTYVPGWQGPGHDAHRQAVSKILDDHHGLHALAERSDAIGDGIRSTASATAKAKYQFYVTISWVLASAAWAYHCAVFTAGASLSWLAAIEAAARIALGQIGQWLVRAIAAAGMGAVLVAGTDALAQGLTVAGGYADGFDVGSFLMSAAVGAAGGAIGLGIGALTGAAELAALGTTELTAGLPGQILVQGVGGYTTQLVVSAADGHLNTDWGGFVAGATGALAGHAVARRGLITGADDAAPTRRRAAPHSTDGWTIDDKPPAYPEKFDVTDIAGSAPHSTDEWSTSGRPPAYSETFTSQWTIDDRPPAYQERLDVSAPKDIAGSAHIASQMPEGLISPGIEAPLPHETTQRTFAAQRRPVRDTAVPASTEQWSPPAPAQPRSAAVPAPPDVHAVQDHGPATPMGRTAQPQVGRAPGTLPEARRPLHEIGEPSWTDLPGGRPGHAIVAGPAPVLSADPGPTVVDRPLQAPPTGVTETTVPTTPAPQGSTGPPTVAVDRPPTSGHAAADAAGPGSAPTAPQVSAVQPDAEPAAQVPVREYRADNTMDIVPAPVDPAVAEPVGPQVPEQPGPGATDQPPAASATGPHTASTETPPSIVRQTVALSPGLPDSPAEGQAFQGPWPAGVPDRPTMEPAATSYADNVRREALQTHLLENPQSATGSAPVAASSPVSAGARSLPGEMEVPGVSRQEIRAALNPRNSGVPRPWGSGVTGKSVYDPVRIAAVLNREPLQVYSYSSHNDPYGFRYRRDSFKQAGVTSCDGLIARANETRTAASPTYTYATSPTAYSYRYPRSERSGSYPASENSGG
nr:hypothetical protein [Streptomyces sp. TLI_235]